MWSCERHFLEDLFWMSLSRQLFSMSFFWKYCFSFFVFSSFHSFFLYGEVWKESGKHGSRRRFERNLHFLKYLFSVFSISKIGEAVFSWACMQQACFFSPLDNVFLWSQLQAQWRSFSSVAKSSGTCWTKQSSALPPLSSFEAVEDIIPLH